MANWCTNYITFYGEKENVSKLETEIDSLIKKMESVKYNEGFVPDGYETVISNSEYIFNLEKQSEKDDDILQIKYDTKWDISSKVLEYLAETYHVEFKGTCEEEQNRADTCSFIFGVFDEIEDMIVVKNTIAETGLIIDYMVEEKSYFSCEFFSNLLDDFADFFYGKFKAAVEDAKYQNEHEVWN